jgi:hypothetical protein
VIVQYVFKDHPNGATVQASGKLVWASNCEPKNAITKQIEEDLLTTFEATCILAHPMLRRLPAATRPEPEPQAEPRTRHQSAVVVITGDTVRFEPAVSTDEDDDDDDAEFAVRPSVIATNHDDASAVPPQMDQSNRPQSGLVTLTELGGARFSAASSSASTVTDESESES